MAVENKSPATSMNTAPVGGEGLFLRKSSGLVREVGLRDTFGIGAGILVLVGAFFNFSTFTQFFPNTDYYIPLLVGAAISLVLAMAYSQLVATFPRSGGEFVYVSRVFSPLAGAMVGGAVFIAVCLNCAATVVQFGQLTTPFLFTTLGKALGIHSLETFGSSTLVGKTPALIVGLIIIGVFATICLRPVGSIVRWVFWCFAIGLFGFAVMVIVLLAQSNAGFIDAFNSASNVPHAYHAIISQAAAGGFQPGITGAAVISAIPVGVLTFGGFTFANYAGGEIKRPAGTYKWAVMAALGIGLVGAIGAWIGLRHSVGLHFMQSSANLQASNPAAYEKITSVPQLQGGWAYSVLATSSPVLRSIIGIGTFVALLANGLGYFMLTSRIVFALSFDRLLPARFADVREKSHAPIYAVALVSLGVLTFTVLGNETSILTLFRNLILVAFAIFIAGSAAAMMLPYRRRDLFEASPKSFKGKILGLPIITVVGALSAAMFVALEVDLATKTAYSGGYSTSSIITLVSVVVVGLLAYAISRVVLLRRGIDLSLAMHELPPE